MTTKQILSLALLTTALTLSAGAPIEIRVTTRQQSSSISTAVANILFQKGIEKEKAFELAKQLTSEDEKTFALMLHNYLKKTSLPQESVLETLAQFALNSKKVDLASYSFLIKLTQSVQGALIEKALFSNLEHISTNNSLIQGINA